MDWGYAGMDVNTRLVPYPNTLANIQMGLQTVHVGVRVPAKVGSTAIIGSIVKGTWGHFQNRIPRNKGP